MEAAGLNDRWLEFFEVVLHDGCCLQMCSIHLPPYLVLPELQRNSPQLTQLSIPSDMLPEGLCNRLPLDKADSAAGFLQVWQGISAVAPSTGCLQRSHPGTPEVVAEEGNLTQGQVPNWCGILPEAEVAEAIPRREFLQRPLCFVSVPVQRDLDVPNDLDSPTNTFAEN